MKFFFGNCAVCGRFTLTQKHGKYFKCYDCWRMGYTPKKNPYKKHGKPTKPELEGSR